MAEQSFEDELKQSVVIQGILMAMPQLVNLYPQIIGLIDYADKELEEKLGDNEKMIIMVKRNGVTRMLVLNTKIPFTISSDMQIEAQGNDSPVLNNYEKSERKAALLNTSILQTLKDKYEKTRDPNKPVEEVSPENMMAFFTNAMSKESLPGHANNSDTSQQVPTDTPIQ